MGHLNPMCCNQTCVDFLCQGGGDKKPVLNAYNPFMSLYALHVKGSEDTAALHTII